MEPKVNYDLLTSWLHVETDQVKESKYLSIFWGIFDLVFIFSQIFSLTSLRIRNKIYTFTPLLCVLCVLATAEKDKNERFRE